jgi:hypothetical protein
LNKQTAALASSFWSALGGMTQLTELNIEQHSSSMHVRPDLAGLTHLRKLTLGRAGDRGEHVAELKQISQLRELTLYDYCPDRIRLLCQPPHALLLDSLTIASTVMAVDETTMRAVLHLPMLTSLDVHNIRPEAWPLLPQLPLLRRLRLSPPGWLTPDRVTSLCAVLPRCSALVDLTLAADIASADFKPFDRIGAEQGQATWAVLLSSVPNLRRLDIFVDIVHLISVLPLHLPQLEHLVLRGCYSEPEGFVSLAHPNVRQLDLVSIDGPWPSRAQLRACLRSKRFPKLERCIRTLD